MDPSFIANGDYPLALELRCIIAMDAIDFAIGRRLREDREKELGELFTRAARAHKLIACAKVFEEQQVPMALEQGRRIGPMEIQRQMSKPRWYGGRVARGLDALVCFLAPMARFVEALEPSRSHVSA